MMTALASVVFDSPGYLWLLLLIPVMVALSWKSLKSLDTGLRTAAVITRCAVIIIVVLCLAGIEYLRLNKDLTVLFLIDRSNSIPKDMYPEQEAYVRESARKAPPNDQVGVITFDGETYVDLLPMKGVRYVEFLQDTPMPDRTDLAGAVRMALALFPHDTAKRVVLVTDGNNNVGDVLTEIETCSARGIGVDVLPMYYLHSREVLVEKLVAPARVKEGDLVPLRAIITAKRPMTGTIILEHNGEPVPLSDDIARVRLEAGQNLIGVKVPVHESMPHRFELQFIPDVEGADTLIENNRATAYTFVGGNEKVLLLSSNPDDDYELVRALQKEKLDIDMVRIEDAEGLDLIGFLRYSAIILSNIGANWFTDEQQADLATYVRDMGCGLIMTGGDEGFGAGGWIGSPIEEIMPVYFEIKHRQVIPRGALVIIMHSCEMPRGNYWGKKVAEKAVDTISSKDYFGLLSFSHLRGVVWEVPLAEATNKTGIKQRIDAMSNGDMPDFRTTMKMAVDGLMELKDASQRHIIIISDGDAQPPSRATIDTMVENKITCSTVGIGYGSHVIEPSLRQIAKQTGGRFYQGRNPRRLPQIFVKESKVVRRPLISEQTFVPVLNYAMSDLWAGFPIDMQIPPLDGLVMTSPKTDGLVEMPLVRHTSDGDDPLLAHWQIGLGKAVAFTSGYWPHWGRSWTRWASFGKLWSQIVRWTMGYGRRGNFDVTTTLEGTTGKIVVNALDNESNYLNHLNLSATVAAPEGAGVKNIRMVQVGPGRYESEFEVDLKGQYVASITLNEGGQVSSVAHTGLSVPYSPEYRELKANEALLQEIVEMSGGRILDMDPTTAEVFRHDLKPTESRQPVWEWVLAWILLPVFLFDVAVRRLASTVALSIFVELLVDVVLLFGVGVIYQDGIQAVWGTLLVLLFGELVGWSIRYKAIRPTLEFFTYSVTSLGGAGQSSAASLEKLRSASDRVRSDRTAAGDVHKPQKIEGLKRETQADAERKFETAAESGGKDVGDVAQALGGTVSKPDSHHRQVPASEQAQDQKAKDFTARLLKARQRARDEMGKIDSPQPQEQDKQDDTGDQSGKQ